MKTILKIMLALLVATSANANTNMLKLDYTTPHGSGVYGDTWPVAANKINVNFSNVIGLIIGGTIGGGSNFYSYTNYITTNLYLTQNNYSYTTTNQYTGSITIYTNIYSGSNYFNVGSNVYVTTTTNYFATYYTGGSTNTIEKFNGGGVDTSITNTLTLINTNIILGYDFSQLIVVSTNQFGVFTTNIYTRTNVLGSGNGYIGTNGDIFIYLPIVLTKDRNGDPVYPPVSGDIVNDDGTLTPTNYTPVRGYSCLLDVQAGTYFPSSGARAVYYYTGTNPVYLPSNDGGDSVGRIEGSIPLGTWNVSHSGWVQTYDFYTDDPPVDGKVYTGYFQTSDHFDHYKVQMWGYEKPKPYFPTNFIPRISATGDNSGSWGDFNNQYTLPIGIENYIILRPQTNACGGITNYLVIGWNPYGTLTGWQIYSNAFGYAPENPPYCYLDGTGGGFFTTNWLVYHQGIWFPQNTIDNYRTSTPWDYDSQHSSYELFSRYDIVDYNTASTGVNLNPPGRFNFGGIGGSPFLISFDTFWLQYYNHNLTKWASSPHSDYGFLSADDPVIYKHPVTLTDEPSLVNYPSAVWYCWWTNATSYATNYAYVLKTSASVTLPPIPPILTLFLTKSPALTTLMTNIGSTNMVMIVTNIIVNAQPIYQRTTLYSKDDSTLGINQVGTPLITYTGSVEPVQLSTNTVAFLRSYPSNTWDWNAVTNGMKDGEFRVAPSNGAALVDLWNSNGYIRMSARPF
ncbi:MAG: hypothetical protein WCH99_08930 [Verrucomicrobiota bacterium]